MVKGHTFERIPSGHKNPRQRCVKCFGQLRSLGLRIPSYCLWFELNMPDQWNENTPIQDKANNSVYMYVTLRNLQSSCQKGRTWR